MSSGRSTCSGQLVSAYSANSTFAVLGHLENAKRIRTWAWVPHELIPAITIQPAAGRLPLPPTYSLISDF